MEKNKVFLLLKIVFLTTFVLLCLFLIKNPPAVQTNLLNAIMSNTKEDKLVVDLSQKYAGMFNVIFESNNAFMLSEVKNDFVNKIDKNAFVQDISETYVVTELLNIYKVYSKNLLSHETAKKIKSGNYKDVKLESLQRLYNPLSVNLLPIEEDPFLLFGDYLQSLSGSQPPKTANIDGSYYETITLRLKDSIALSPTLLNNEMNKLLALENEIEKSNPYVKIRMAGAPVHTFYASSASMKEINVICILSSLFIILLCKFYFRSFKILIPIGTSIGLGIFVGYILTSLFFSTIHVLTFVFSTTLIGICVDYSLHYFAKINEIGNLIKSLTIGMATTVVAFLTLLCSNMELLQQIAVFTSGGLVSVYIFVLLFYPFLCKKLNINLDAKADLSKLFSLTLSRNVKIIVFSIVGILTVCGLFQVRFNDGIKDMYKPPKHLLESEKLLAQINGNSSDTTFLVVKGDNIQSVLETEELITSKLRQGDFYSLSLLLPSQKRQLENRKLIKQLYVSELDNYADFLTPAMKLRILQQKPYEDFLTIDKLPKQITEKFLIDNNTSVMLAKNVSKQTITGFNNVSVINLQKDISKRVRDCRHSCLKLIVPVFVVLLLLLTCVYKKIAVALKIVCPPLCGCVFTLGMLGLFHQSINLFHVLALFLIMGFSLDYSVFRFNGSKNSVDSNAAVLISCATSVFSFLLLSMTSFKLISSLGLVLALGLTSSYIFSLFLISKE